MSIHLYIQKRDKKQKVPAHAFPSPGVTLAAVTLMFVTLTISGAG